MISDFDVSAGLTPKHLREQAEVWYPNSALLDRISKSIEEELRGNPKATPLEIAWAVISDMGVVSDRMRIRLRLIAVANGKPMCAICGLRIFLDEKSNSHAEISMDHIHRIADGGRTDIKNLQLAHRLCNSMRQVTGKKSAKKLADLKKYLEDKIEKHANVTQR